MGSTIFPLTLNEVTLQNDSMKSVYVFHPNAFAKAQLATIRGTAVPGPLLTIKSTLQYRTINKLYNNALRVVKILVK